MTGPVKNVPKTATITVLNSWYDPFAGLGQTTMKLQGNVPTKTLHRAAIRAAREEIQIRFPIDVHDIIVPVRLYKAPRFPGGSRIAFVVWVVGHPSTRTLHRLQRLSLRAWAVLTRSRGT